MTPPSISFRSISFAAIVLSATLGVLITPVCSLAQWTPREGYRSEILRIDCNVTLHGECIDHCPRVRRNHWEFLDKACIQRCKRAFGC